MALGSVAHSLVEVSQENIERHTGWETLYRVLSGRLGPAPNGPDAWGNAPPLSGGRWDWRIPPANLSSIMADIGTRKCT